MNLFQRRFIGYFLLFFALIGEIITVSPATPSLRTHKLRRKKRRRLRRARKLSAPRERTFRKIFYPKFSQTLSKFIDHADETNFNGESYVWKSASPIAFNELILSWNALRPTIGKITFYVRVKHSGNWSPRHRLAEWGADTQKTFTNKYNPYVHTKYVRVEMQRNLLASEFEIEAKFSDGASFQNLNALFACASNLNHFRVNRTLPKKIFPAITGVPQQSQMIIDHPRAKDLCSPASTSMIVKYFTNKLYGPTGSMHDFVANFAEKVLDNSIDIYGNWPLNVAQAHDASDGHIFFRVERLNSFSDLCEYLSLQIPVAVSVRRLKGGATPYSSGHFMVIVGFDPETQNIKCIDPAFRGNGKTLKNYKLAHFLPAWALSRNLSYIPMPRHSIWQWDQITAAA